MLTLTSKQAGPTAMRILMVVPKYPYPVTGGLERQAHELSRTLIRDCDVTVHVLAARFDSSHKSQDVVEGVSVTRVGWSDTRWVRFVLLPFQVAHAIWEARDATDVIHVHQHSPFGLYAIAVSRLLGLPVLAKLPNYGQYGIPGMRRTLTGRIKARVLLRASAFVAMSGVCLDELVQAGVPRSRVLTIPNGIVPSQPRSTDPLPAQPVSASRCRVVYVGRINPEKQVDVLLRAWHKIHGQVASQAVLEIWGDGPLRAELEQWCRDRDLCNSVLWRGHVADVRNQLATADMFVLPSSNEGNSNAILEAMDAALPVVTTPVGGTPMQLGPHGAPFLTPVDDADAMAQRLLLLISDPHLRRQYGAALRSRALEYFDLSKVAQGYVCAYRKLATSQEVDLTDCARLPAT
jgi:glycosyltransferase involved in cell wall biosynthesis